MVRSTVRLHRAHAILSFKTISSPRGRVLGVRCRGRVGHSTLSQTHPDPNHLSRDLSGIRRGREKFGVFGWEGTSLSVTGSPLPLVEGLAVTETTKRDVGTTGVRGLSDLWDPFTSKTTTSTSLRTLRRKDRSKIPTAVTSDDPTSGVKLFAPRCRPRGRSLGNYKPGSSKRHLPGRAHTSHNRRKEGGR